MCFPFFSSLFQPLFICFYLLSLIVRSLSHYLFISVCWSQFQSVCSSLLQTDGRAQGHGEVSGWGDGLQGGRVTLLRTSSLAFFVASASSICSPSYVFTLSPRTCAVSVRCRHTQRYTQSQVLGCPAASQCTVYICVCTTVCVCVFADRMGFCEEKQPPEWGREQIGVGASVSLLINLLFNSWPHRRLNTCTLLNKTHNS